MKASSAPKLLFNLMFLSFLTLSVTGCADPHAATASIESTPEVKAPTQDYVQEYGYPTNDAGLTYGPLMPYDFYGQDAEYDPDVMPDLLLVTADEGYAGYVYWEEMFGPDPSSIEDALEDSSSEPRAITVYTEDGNTVIGTFTIEKGGQNKTQY